MNARVIHNFLTASYSDKEMVKLLIPFHKLYVYNISGHLDVAALGKPDSPTTLFTIVTRLKGRSAF